MNDNDLKKSTFLLRLHERHFKSEINCLGEQLVEIINCIREETSDLIWFAFDVFGSSDRAFAELFSNAYSEFLSTDELIEKASGVIQFYSGVFIGIKKGRHVEWNFDRLPDTEENEGLQHPEAEIEIRPFDTSYFEIYGMDSTIESKIKLHFMLSDQ
ncbi:hypothetical protein QE450_000035 [Paenibacillus sp. SORGH_AS306]|uniref:hypothetical protein n=1 Tax=unclassified Paenibacillus TaxID=185978 RepID=UPI0027824F88|nr:MULTISPECIES: hypothetical protein [unclassified Paenibacillus]MDQ1232537.1 hypothetical protein [Paenibacillus sp. SORGH_AS_0306]MDR6109587.1 hypothetical protein [Paenibacillus sp. SORGH_AS_0338]